MSRAFAISFSDVATAALISAFLASSFTCFVSNVVAAWFTAFASETAFSKSSLATVVSDFSSFLVSAFLSSAFSSTFSTVFSTLFKLLIAASNTATCASTCSYVADACATRSLALFNSTAALTVLTCLSSDNSCPANDTNKLSNWLILA